MIAGVVLLLSAGAALAKDTQFWNLTVDTIVKFQLSPPGKNQWGDDQTASRSATASAWVRPCSARCRPGARPGRIWPVDGVTP